MEKLLEEVYEGSDMQPLSNTVTLQGLGCFEDGNQT
jgi:hypothetical protein